MAGGKYKIFPYFMRIHKDGYASLYIFNLLCNIRKKSSNFLFFVNV